MQLLFFTCIIRYMTKLMLINSLLVIFMVFVGGQLKGDVLAYIGQRPNTTWLNSQLAVNIYDVRTRMITTLTPRHIYPQIFNWSPDGDYIALIGRAYGDIQNPSGLYVMRSDGGDFRLLSGNLLVIITTERPPFWTADSRHVIFQAQQPGGNLTQFYRVGLDAIPPELVDLNHPDVQMYIRQLFPTYERAPNGHYMAQVDYRDNAWGLFVAIDGQHKRIYPLTAEEMMPDAPDWSPDSTRIAFSLRQNRVPMIRVISWQGEQIFDIRQARYPLWKPAT